MCLFLCLATYEYAVPQGHLDPALFFEKWPVFHTACDIILSLCQRGLEERRLFRSSFLESLRSRYPIFFHDLLHRNYVPFYIAAVI